MKENFMKQYSHYLSKPLRLLAIAVGVAATSGAAHAQSTISFIGTVRDFLYANTPSGTYNGNMGMGHPDFENTGDFGVKTNLVQQTLTNPTGASNATLLTDTNARFATGILANNNYSGAGASNTNVGPTLSSASNFSQWYTNTPGVNVLSGYYTFVASQSAPGVYTYNNQTYFPMNFTQGADTFTPRNGGGFGTVNADGSTGTGNNFSFTTEIRTNFQYTASANQSFTYNGDDDVYVYINGRLAIDLGGVHPAANQTINLNTLAGQANNPFALTDGGTNRLDIFTAERHTTGSTLRIDTNIPLVAVVPPGFAAVPEAGTLALLLPGFALVGAVIVRRRK